MQPHPNGGWDCGCAERNVVHTALFISFFPTVLAGPINRYSRLRL